MTDGRRNVVIVGASAAGLRCASRLARLRPDWRVTVVEARETFSWAACGLPYVLSGDIPGPEALRRTGDGAVRDAAYFADVKGVEVLAGARAVAADAATRTLRLRDGAGDERDLPWDELVLATGAAPRRLPGQPDHLRVTCFHTDEDLRPLHAGLARGELSRVAIVGAGFLGCELAEAFTALWGAEVILVEAAPTPLPGLLDPEVGALVARALAAADVDLRCGAGVERLDADDDGVRLHLADGGLAEADAAVVAAGVAPESALARDLGAAVGPAGAVLVDERLATTVPHVWAAGDAVAVRCAVTGEPVHVPLGSLANRQGRTLADVLAGRDAAFPPVAGAAAVKVCDLNVAAVGLTRARAGAAAASVWITAHDRADYWPESAEIVLQLTYRPADGRVLGVQAAGEGEVAKRIDIAAQLLRRGALLADFVQLEHAYSPPYAPALEPLAVAAMVAENARDGLRPAPPLTALSAPGGPALLDVRHPEEREARPLGRADAAAVPLEELRGRAAALGPGPWLTVCERGTRAAEALRILRAQGADGVYLAGGLRWRELAGIATTADASAAST